MVTKVNVREAGTSTVRILLVEDHQTQREQLARALERQGFKVFQAKDSKEALERMEEGRPSAVIVDHILGDEMDGIDLASRIRGRYPATSVIFMSGKSPTSEEEKKAHENGVSLRGRWLEKPLQMGEVSAVIRRELAAMNSLASVDAISLAIDKVYDEMRSVIASNAGKPGLRDSLVPLRDKLRGLQAQEAELIARRYDAHFTDLYERGQDLIRRARQILRDE